MAAVSIKIKHTLLAKISSHSNFKIISFLGLSHSSRYTCADGRYSVSLYS